MEKNGIQMDLGFSKILVISQTAEKMAGVNDGHAGKWSTNSTNARRAKNMIVSSLLSSASTSRISNSVSKETFQHTEELFPDSHEIRMITTSSLTLRDSVTESSMKDLATSSNTSGLHDELDTLMNNSALSTSVVTNYSLDLSSSSWTPKEVGAVTVVSLMVPFIFVSNLLVIMSVVRFRRLHTPTNYFIASLAVVDVFVALAVPFVMAVEDFQLGSIMGPNDVILCLLPNRVLTMMCGASVLTLATIAYDRHTALAFPLEYVNIMTTKKVIIMVTLTWIYSAIIVWLPLMTGWYNVPPEHASCSANLFQAKVPVLFFTAIFIPSCIAILVCYFRIFMIARHHAKAIAAVEFAVHRRLQVKFIIKDTKYAKTLAMVIGIFLALWLPYFICILIELVSSISVSVWVQTYLILLAVFNSGINPWVYAFKNNEFKAAFKRLFQDFCRDTFSRHKDRRHSLVSAVSSTPRLSRTDSRMAVLMPEITVCSISETLKRSADSLHGHYHEIQTFGPARFNNKRRRTITEGIPPKAALLSPGRTLRQAASCSNLTSANSLKLDNFDSSKTALSVSFDSIAPSSVIENTRISCESLDSGIYHQIFIDDDFTTFSPECRGNECHNSSHRSNILLSFSPVHPASLHHHSQKLFPNQHHRHNQCAHSQNQHHNHQHT